ncbi:pyridoxal-phosphate dependent enzyme [Streptacidiphilus sp. N1-1]|uniref:Pyridoxal-phosphate dependent enzyme n=1 Tax=Streptacidiphilus alkalitolerans TaxID=3342712 RepID=A0ABV6VIK9_9ACTN
MPQDPSDAAAPLTAVDRTPVHRLPRLAALLGMQQDALWIKRDDLTGLAGGGNKARKLVPLLAAARAAGADTLVTGGGAQSNHARMTAAAAAIHGMGSHLVLNRPPVPDQGGNLLLDGLFGAGVTWTQALPFADLQTAIEECCEKLRAGGRKPYSIPVGGSSVLGASAYLDVAQEIGEQLDPGLVVVATGSGGTHAGLAAGFGDHARVLGVDVGALPDVATVVRDLSTAVAAHAGREAPRGSVSLDRARIGDGYGLPTEAGHEALLAAARCDGILLDPVYTAKAMAGLFAARRDGRIEASTRVLFLHTGGLPGLFAHRYADWAGSLL